MNYIHEQVGCGGGDINQQAERVRKMLLDGFLRSEICDKSAYNKTSTEYRNVEASEYRSAVTDVIAWVTSNLNQVMVRSHDGTVVELHAWLKER